MHTIFWLENLKGIDYMEDLGVDGKITLEWILRKWVGVDWINLAQHKDHGGPFEHGNEPLVTIKIGEYLD
jgi:hypothetical protein